jgi:hypothetical protein
MNSVPGPDFICIGMPKSGTGWLYDQLSHHPDFWMPPIKELHYLDRLVPRLENSIEVKADWKRGKRRARRSDLPWGRPERSFVRDAASLAGQPRDMSRYAALFRHKGKRLSGDISPGYCSADDETITEIAGKLPETKIVLLVREPIARAWSRVCMAHRDGKFDVALLEDPVGFQNFLEDTRYIAHKSFPTRIVERWSRCAPRLPFHIILFDDLEQRANDVSRDILTYLGTDPEKRSGLPSEYNKKAGAKKLAMPDSIRKVFISYLGDEIHRCAARFGGAARAWPQKYCI